MADFDFTGLTETHRRLLDRGGWTVAEASGDNVQPSARQVAKLLDRGLLTTRIRMDRIAPFSIVVTEYVVPDAVAKAWKAVRRG